MWEMLQQNDADDFVFATGESHTIREFVDVVFKELGIELEWHGENENEKGIVKTIQKEKLKILKEDFHNTISIPMKTGEESLKSTFAFSLLPFELGDVLVSVDPSYYRPTEVACPYGDLLIRDAAKAKACPPFFWRETLGWEAHQKEGG